MALIFIAADDHDGYVSNTAETDVFVKTGVLLGVQFAALQLLATDHDVTVQGAIVGRNYGIDMGLRASNKTGCGALRGDGETPPF